jgi:hypothetical protein
VIPSAVEVQIPDVTPVVAAWHVFIDVLTACVYVAAAVLTLATLAGSAWFCYLTWRHVIMPNYHRIGRHYRCLRSGGHTHGTRHSSQGYGGAGAGVGAPAPGLAKASAGGVGATARAAAPAAGAGAVIQAGRRTAFRAWVVESGRLRSYWHYTYYRTDSPMRADCRHDMPHAAPAPDCECGLHALYDLNPFNRWLRQIREECGRDSVVTGAVYLSGVVHRHDDGMRAEKMQVAALLRPAPADEPWFDVDAIAAAYGVPVLDTFELLRAVATEHAPLMERPLR